MITKLIRSEITYRRQKPCRLLFDHLPKCAGTTVTKYLLRHFPPRLVFNTKGRNPQDSVRQFNAMPVNSRFGYELILGHSAGELLDLVHPDTLALTILRDPIDRVVSYYFFVQQDKKHPLHERVVTQGISLEEFTASPMSGELQNWYTSHFARMTVAEVDENPDEALQRAMQVLENCYDIIGFQDDLPGVIQRLKDEAGLLQEFENVVMNKTRVRPEVGGISDEARCAIERFNAVDLRLYEMLRHREDLREPRSRGAAIPA